MTKKKFQGTGTALVTPFSRDGSIDVSRLFSRLVNHQIRGGIDMIVHVRHEPEKAPHLETG